MKSTQKDNLDVYPTKIFKTSPYVPKKKHAVTAILASCRNQNFGRAVTGHGACWIDRNGTVRLRWAARAIIRGKGEVRLEMSHISLRKGCTCQTRPFGPLHINIRENPNSTFALITEIFGGITLNFHGLSQITALSKLPQITQSWYGS